MKTVLFFLSIIILSQGCSTIDVFEKTVAFDNQEWHTSNKPNFVFAITDTASVYNIFIVLRHSDAYHFNNIWLNVTTIAPGDTANTQQLNLKLGDNTKGWLGAAMDDIIEHRILITKNPVHLKKGNYTFLLQEIMREEPLQNFLNAGIRVEKATQ